MARIRFMIELNPGGVGVRLDKLARISGELEKFVRHLANDSGADLKSGEWVAKDFYNSSLGAVVEYVGHVDASVVGRFNSGIRFFSRFQAKNASGISRYSDETVRQFVEVGEVLDSDERVKIGIIDDDNGPEVTEWQEITRDTTLSVDEVARQEVLWDGAIQGTLGTWYKESGYFNLKDFTFGQLVKCFYPASMYDEVHSLFKNKDAVVHVNGRVVSDRSTGRPKQIRVALLQEFDPLSDAEFERMLSGSANLRGGVATLDYIERRRGDDDR